jgi:penicillin amidase
LTAASKPNIGYSWSPPARVNRIREVLGTTRQFTAEDFQRLQHDATPWNAERLVPLLQPMTFRDPEIERARRLLTDWDKRLAQDSAAAALYVEWESELTKRLARRFLDKDLAAEYLQHESDVLVPTLTTMPEAWFGAHPAMERDALLESSLTAAVASLKQTLGSDMSAWRWGRLHTATFAHPLAATSAAARARFDVGPFSRAGYGDTVFSTGGPGYLQDDGATFREVMDVADWDRSVGTSAPGQSGQPGSPHFDDLAKMWAAEQYFPYSFTDAVVQKNAEATLVLMPRR